MPHLTRKLQGFGTSIFAEMTALAARHQAVNLGQGFPDFDGPDFLKRAAIAAIEQGKNQYARSHGMPVLNAAIAQHRARFYGLSFDPETEITVMNGATECIAATMLSLLDEGDEVVTFEPFLRQLSRDGGDGGRASTGTMWVVLSDITGMPASRSSAFSRSARSCRRSRRWGHSFTMRTLSNAAAAIEGASEVVKIKPEAVERIASIAAAGPVT